MIDISNIPTTPVDSDNLIALAWSPNAPAIKTVLQYLKDLSFESVRPFARATGTEPEPTFDVVIGIHNRKAEEGQYMVEFSIRAEARSDGQTMFLAELIYVGCYVLENVPDEHIEPMLHLQCAPLLFPYARQILDDAVQKGGYPPMHIDVSADDYVSLFRGHLARKKREAAADQTKA